MYISYINRINCINLALFYQLYLCFRTQRYKCKFSRFFWIIFCSSALRKLRNGIILQQNFGFFSLTTIFQVALGSTYFFWWMLIEILQFLVYLIGCWERKFLESGCILPTILGNANGTIFLSFFNFFSLLSLYFFMLL